MPFLEFCRRHPGFLATCLAIILAFGALDGWLARRRQAYEQEITRLRAGMSDFERQRSDAILSTREKRLDMMVKLLRRQARGDQDIHLAVSVDSGRMYLERAGALLREIPVQVGPARRIGTPPDTVELAVPRGTRSVEATVNANEPWDVPDWVYQDRHLRVPPNRTLPGALGPAAIILDGGTVIYSLPATGPLGDSTYVLPGSVRAQAADLEAIIPNLTKGTAVYFY